MWKEQIGKTHCVPRCVRLCQRLECFLRLVPFVKDRGSKSKNSLYPEKRLDDYTMSLFIPATIYWQCSVIARCLYGMTVIKWMTIFTDWKTALWGLKATSWMPHQIKAKSAAKEYRASLGKGYRPVASASCVLGQKMMCQCAEDHLDPPWKSNRSVGRRVLGGPLCHHSEMELAQKANKISPHLSLKPRPTLVWVMGFSVVLFVCLFGLEPMDTQHGVREEKRRNGGRTGKERRGGDEGGGRGCVTHRPPLEVTRDLPRSYRAKLLNKYTQTPGSGQQRRIAVSDPSTDVISDTCLTATTSFM